MSNQIVREGVIHQVLTVDENGDYVEPGTGGGTTGGALEVTQLLVKGDTAQIVTNTDRSADVLEAAVADTTPIPVVPGAVQDPIFDHANGTKTSVTTSTGIITPPTGCKFVRISSDVDIFVRTDNAAAVDDGTSIRIVANSPEIIPVVAAVQVRALSSSGTAVVRCTPFKVR